MEPEEMDPVELELKYCERCGGLWLRERGLQTPYCVPCAAALVDFPRPLTRKRPPRLPVNRDCNACGVVILPQEGGVA